MKTTLDVTFDQLEKWGYPSVTDYCRYLVDDGNYDGVVLGVWRGDMLCLIVNDVYEAAKLMPTGTDFVSYHESKRGRAFKGPLQPRGEV